MKTREEMIYEFMLQLSTNPELWTQCSDEEHYVSSVFGYASMLVNKYLERT